MLSISAWSWLEAASQRLVQHLEAMAMEELQKAKEEKVHLAGRLQEAAHRVTQIRRDFS